MRPVTASVPPKRLSTSPRISAPTSSATADNPQPVSIWAKEGARYEKTDRNDDRINGQPIRLRAHFLRRRSGRRATVGYLWFYSVGCHLRLQKDRSQLGGDRPSLQDPGRMLGSHPSPGMRFKEREYPL